MQSLEKKQQSGHAWESDDFQLCQLFYGICEQTYTYSGTSPLSVYIKAIPLLDSQRGLVIYTAIYLHGEFTLYNY